MNPAAPSNSISIGISATSITRIFPMRVAALSPISLSISPGEFVSILGPSGCGKSTLLRLIAGLDHPTTGSLQLLNASTNHPQIAYVFQDAHLLPWRTVLRNVTLPLELLHVPKPQRLELSRHLLEQVGLTDAIHRYPAQLSGGMRMRVSLARALVTNPKLLLLDEPFAALDEITRHRLDEQLRALWSARQITTVFVTHSTAEAAFLANRAIVLSPRPGRILLDTPIDLPPQRTAALRTTDQFAHQTFILSQALERQAA